ncbi:AraC family transcriptional regulator [Chryseobacterium sp. Tr-659]|uniref:AraC family transcriptional regulator n=1 Tax=Chryseobacterium sp. Tr-659 TaxID=2608340 RepID=UPI00141F8ABE|nr:AraC family transcriptional regulator [Chryseobacterium sp. Tr-659]
MTQALKVADSMISASTTLQHKGRSMMLKASLYMQQSKYNESLKFAEQSKDIFNTTNNYELQAKIRGFLATEYRIIGLNQKSKKCADEGLNIANKISNPQKQAQVKALFSQELAYYAIDIEKNYNNAAELLNNSLRYISKVPQDKITLGRTYQMLGEVNCFYLNNYDLAEKDYRKALENLPEQYYVTGLTYEGLGKIRTYQQRYDEAEKFYLKALEFAESSDHPEMKKRIYNGISEYYEKTNQYKKAAIYRKKFAESTWNETVKYIKSVDKDYSKVENEKEEYVGWNNIKTMIISIASVLILVLIIIFIMNRKKHKKEYRKFKSIIDHYKEKEEYVLEAKADTPAKSIEDIERNTVQGSEEITQSSVTISKESETKILEQLDLFEKNEIFNNKNVSLTSLAAEFNTNIRYVSYVVKKYKNTDFKNYINKLRVNYIIHKLNTFEKYRKYKVSALADECGFSTHAQFTTTFKSITGISPSNFISFIEQEKSKED